jgi:CDP-6-deoxy-D-xylo-4-hexulose-3-dehydrase
LPKENHVCGTKGDDAFDESFRFVLPGYNLRPLELSGAVGLVQLKKLPEMIAVRRENAVKFLEVVSAFPWLRAQREIGKSSWFGFSVVLEPDAPVRRDRLIAALVRHGIEVRPIVAGNFARSEALRWFDYSVYGALRAAEYIDANGLFIGNHHYRLSTEFDLMVSALSEAESVS